MPVPLFQVDAFTSEAFSGNPAGVCILDEPASDSWMQRVAAEMNLSETVFLFDEGPRWRVRYFTPSTEVDLCGHATVALTHILVENGTLGVDETAEYATRAGPVRAAAEESEIRIEIPAEPGHPVDRRDDLVEAVGVEPLQVHANALNVLLEVADEAAVAAATPDFRRLRVLHRGGVIVTARADRDADIVVRYFAPGLGVDEDPATGSIQAFLVPYWQPRIGEEVVTRQLSQRPSRLRARTVGKRVHVWGAAVTVFEGVLRVPIE